MLRQSRRDVLRYKRHYELLARLKRREDKPTTPLQKLERHVVLMGVAHLKKSGKDTQDLAVLKRWLKIQEKSVA